MTETREQREARMGRAIMDLSPHHHPVDVLLSFAFHKSTRHKDMVQALPDGSMVWIDSGAWTAYTTGKTPFTVKEYAHHLEVNRGGWDYAFSLDVIGDPKASRRQTEKLWELGFKVVPVFHYGSPLSEWRSLCKEYGYLGAGGVVPLAKKSRTKAQRYLKTLVTVANEYGTAVHALGQASRELVNTTGVWSADSSSIHMGTAVGSVAFWDNTRNKIVGVPLTEGARLYKHRHQLWKYDVPVEQVLRDKRWTPTLRAVMVRAGMLSVSDYWGHQHNTRPASPPPRLWAPDRGLPKVYRDSPVKKVSQIPGPRIMHALVTGGGTPTKKMRGQST